MATNYEHYKKEFEEKYLNKLVRITDIDNEHEMGILKRAGEKVLIPINMRDGCIIGVGKGNIDYNYTAPHGAGRIMSRNEARKTISVQSFEDSMKGIYSSSVCINTLDESPMAYKPMQEIIDNIKETVDIQKIIKPIYNFKAS